MRNLKLFQTGMAIALTLITPALPLNAQADTLNNLPNLLFPQFTRSIIKFKSGETKTAILNYNTVGQEMVFRQKQYYMVLDDPQLIDTVYIANRKFIPFEKSFYEVLVAAPLSLFVQHKSYVESKGSPIGYGAMSQTTANSYVSTVYGARGAVNLEVPDNFKVVDDSEYWIRKDGSLRNFTGKRQFLKIFPEKEKELEQYINKNKINFKNHQNLIDLIIYCNELYR